MKACCTIIFILILQSPAFSQRVPLLTIDQLNNRIANGKDTTYIINFWATWCVPCIKELPHFEKLNAAYKTAKLKVLLVSVDFKSQLNTAVILFVKRSNIKNEVFLLNETNQQEYIDRVDTSWSGAIPATLFIKNNKRKFIENAFTYPELITAYKTIQ